MGRGITLRGYIRDQLDLQLYKTVVERHRLPACSQAKQGLLLMIQQCSRDRVSCMRQFRMQSRHKIHRKKLTSGYRGAIQYIAYRNRGQLKT